MKKIVCDFCIGFRRVVRPEVTLAKNCGLEIGRAILVNEKMQTKDEAVFAAGDCAEYLEKWADFIFVRHRLLWARSEVRYMAGEDASYTPVIPATALSPLGVSLFGCRYQ